MSQTELVWESKPKKRNIIWLFVLPLLAVAFGSVSYDFFSQGRVTYGGVSGLISVAASWAFVSVALPSVIRIAQGKPYTAIAYDGIVHGWKIHGWKDVEEVAYRIKEPAEMVFLAEGQKELFSIDLSDGANREYAVAHMIAAGIIRKIRSDALNTATAASSSSHWGDATRGRF